MSSQLYKYSSETQTTCLLSLFAVVHSLFRTILFVSTGLRSVNGKVTRAKFKSISVVGITPVSVP